MALSLTVSTNVFYLPAAGTFSGPISLTNGQPFRLESAEGMSGADVVRLSQRSPQQSGVTDLGFRLQPREVTLSILFNAATGTLLDLYRQTLQFSFSPESPILLTVTRDDGESRVLTCYAVDEVAIDLVPEDRPGFLHRAIIKVRAPNPLLKDRSPTAASTIIGQWWTAGGYIGTAQIREHVDSPTQSQNWAWSPATDITSDWAIAVNTGAHTGGSVHYLFDTFAATGGSLTYTNSTGRYSLNGGSGTTWPGGTAANYHVFSNESGTSVWRYWSGTAVNTHGSWAGDINLDADGEWREEFNSLDGRWTPAVTRALTWGTPTTTQMLALAPYIMGSVTNGIVGLNSGDMPAYPYITLTGPLVDPVLTNRQTGGSINLAGLTLGSAETCAIDLRTGDKRLTGAGGNNLLGSITTLPISMADFYLAPAPQAPAGVNVIEVTGGSVGTAAIIALSHTNSYLSW